jgi:hypothetical protein
MILANNIAAFANVLGSEYPALVIKLAQIPFASDSDRDNFIYEIAALDAEQE